MMSQDERMNYVYEKDVAVLVVVDPQNDEEAVYHTNEMQLLLESAETGIEETMHFKRDRPHPKTYIGPGQAEDVYTIVQDTGANVVVVSEELSSAQQQHLEDIVRVKVVDRTQLILDIFARRARTREGKIQVELAQLEYLLPRLAGKGILMSRIGGASGGLSTRGPGETKLETDRRHIRNRISHLKKDLQKVVKHRETQRKGREKMLIPQAALVGYTSAGKSTLLNALAGTDVETHAKLFATLDPTTRKIDFEGTSPIILSDTVGFLRNLPHGLIAAFRATLEEVLEADFLMHVVDSAHPYLDEQYQAVVDVLTELGAGEKPMITVFNKCDIAPDKYALRTRSADTPDSCYISALTGDGLEDLESLIHQKISEMVRTVTAVIPFDRGDLLALCHERGSVTKQEHIATGTKIEAELANDLASRLSDYIVD